MKIGIDISSLQGPHRMRGIGFTLINILNNLPPDARKKHKYVFYAFEENQADAFDIFDLRDIDYEVRSIEEFKRITKRLPGKLNIIVLLLNQLYALFDIHFGDSRYKNLQDLDIFLQSDQSISLPRGSGFKKALILYDIIPYVIEWDYMWSFKTARANGLSRTAATRCALRRYKYKYAAKSNCKRADILLAISEHTKQDFIKHIGIKGEKIVIAPLGVNKTSTDSKKIQHRYISTSWGYSKRQYQLAEDEKFLLYLGGTDQRRKIDDLVNAFNHLRAGDEKIKLYLGGDVLEGPNNLPVKSNRDALLKSSYQEDICYLGFVSEEEKTWLYQNAVAFVYPSMYEGFGLPVIEAMANGCPVICYENSSIAEVAGNAAMYANDYLSIVDFVKELLDSPEQRKTYVEKGLIRSKRFTWDKTVSNIMGTLD